MHKKNLVSCFQKISLVAIIFGVAFLVSFFVGNYQTAQAKFSDTGKVGSVNNNQNLKKINEIHNIENITDGSKIVKMDVDSNNNLTAYVEGEKRCCWYIYSCRWWG